MFKRWKRPILVAALALAVTPAIAAANDCKSRWSLFYTSNCQGHVCTFAMQTLVCDSDVYWWGFLLECEGSCPVAV